MSVGNRGSGASQPVSNMGSETAPPASQFPKFGNWRGHFFLRRLRRRNPEQNKSLREARPRSKYMYGIRVVFKNTGVDVVRYSNLKLAPVKHAQVDWVLLGAGVKSGCVSVEISKKIAPAAQL